jgi:hypothetical protein
VGFGQISDVSFHSAKHGISGDFRGKSGTPINNPESATPQGPIRSPVQELFQGHGDSFGPAGLAPAGFYSGWPADADTARPP